MAPGNNQSGGVSKRAPTVPGNPHIKAALVESGWWASRTKDSEFLDRYNRLKTRIGHKRAIVATAHSLALTVYTVLQTGEPYGGAQPRYKVRDIERLRRHHSRRLRALDRWLDERPSG